MFDFLAASRILTGSWRQRIRAYQAFFDSPAMEKRYGTSKIRVLTVTAGRRRLVDLKEATQGVGGLKRYWFAEAARLTPNTALTTRIWSVASVSEECELIPNP